VEISSALVVGSNGKFGKLLSSKFAEAGVQVYGMDLQKSTNQNSSLKGYFQGSLTKMDRDLEDLLRRIDCVILCVPEDIAIASLQSLTSSVADDAVIVDIASVKAPIVSELKKCRVTTGFLSIHPMFPPVPNFSGRSIIVSTINKNAYSDAFMRIMTSWGASIIEMSPEEHDIATSFVQALPHAALIAFGLTIKDSGISFSKIWEISTPIQKTLLAALLRVVSNDRLTHFDLQYQNPFAPNTRRSFAAALSQVNEITATANSQEFINCLSEIDAMMTQQRTTLENISSSIISSTQRSALPELANINRDLDTE
jgi:4-amino-4-deoxyprephenate dehydrogenase